jgi:hypothetical protein
MPRIVTNALPAFCVSTSVTFGVRPMKSRGCWMPAAWIVDALNAVTATPIPRACAR